MRLSEPCTPPATGGRGAVGVPATISSHLVWTDPGAWQVFTEADFAVGKQCNINGCDFLIYGCDEFTRDYYEKVTPTQCSTQPPPPPP